MPRLWRLAKNASALNRDAKQGRRHQQQGAKEGLESEGRVDWRRTARSLCCFEYHDFPGQSSGPAVEAAQAAISSPLLETERIDGAKGCVINISGGKDMTLEDMTTASEVIYDVVDPEANIIVGAVVDDSLEGEIHVTVIATGFENGQHYRSEKKQAKKMSASQPLQQQQEVEDSGARIPEFLRQRQNRDR